VKKHAGSFALIIEAVAAQHNITADVEVIPIQKVNEAYGRLVKSDVKYRFCMEMASLKSK
jgi:uncharacterized zinc-type alcohol dehydrogenase-like protein